MRGKWGLAVVLAVVADVTPSEDRRARAAPIAQAVPTSDESLRCGTRLVELGDTLAEVRGKCGEPASRKQRKFRRRGMVVATVDEWVYDLGATSFVRILTFQSGRLTSIKAG